MTSTARAVSILVLPLWGIAADYFGATKKVLLLALTGTIVFLLAFLTTELYGLIFILLVFLIIFEGPIVSLSDSLVLNQLGDESDHYGKVRMWGSLGYMLAVTPIGLFIEHTTARSLFYISAVVLLLAFYKAFKLPGDSDKIKVANIADFKVIFKNKELLLFLIFTFFIQTPLMANFTFFPIFFKAQGGGETLFGLAMLIAASSEFFVFQKSTFFFRKFNLATILLISSLAFSVRWAFLGFFPVILVLLLSQLFHSLSFALFHVTAVNYISRLVGADFQATGQNLFASTIAISSVTGSLLGGIVYDYLGGTNLYLLGSLISLMAGLGYYLYQRKTSLPH